jgi:hypothetical protein
MLLVEGLVEFVEVVVVGLVEAEVKGVGAEGEVGGEVRGGVGGLFDEGFVGGFGVVLFWWLLLGILCLLV